MIYDSNFIKKIDTEDAIIILSLYDGLVVMQEDPILYELQYGKFVLSPRLKKLNIIDKQLKATLLKLKNIIYEEDLKVIRLLPHDYDKFIDFVEQYKDDLVELSSIDNNDKLVEINDDVSEEENLIVLLKTLYLNAPSSYQMTVLHLFGVKYKDKLSKYKISNIAFKATGKLSLWVEISKGMKMSDYVTIKKDLLKSILDKIGRSNDSVDIPAILKQIKNDTPRLSMPRTWQMEDMILRDYYNELSISKDTKQFFQRYPKFHTSRYMSPFCGENLYFTNLAPGKEYSIYLTTNVKVDINKVHVCLNSLSFLWIERRNKNNYQVVYYKCTGRKEFDEILKEIDSRGTMKA